MRSFPLAVLSLALSAALASNIVLAQQESQRSKSNETNEVTALNDKDKTVKPKSVNKKIEVISIFGNHNQLQTATFL